MLLQMTSTGELERLVSVYSLTSLSPHLSDFERDAVIAAIRDELGERDMIRKGFFQFSNEREYPWDVIDYKEHQLCHLEDEVNALDAMLEATMNSESKDKS
jgi:hypothetical protein